MASPSTETTAAATARPTVAPRLRVRNAASAIEFYQHAFGAREIMRFEAGGEIPHAELAIGNSVFMLGEEAPEHGYPGPQTLGGAPLTMQLDVPDVDAAVDRAVAAGARLVMPVSDQFYGARTGQVQDPFGFTWAISTHKEEVPLEEMHRRLKSMQKEARKPALQGARKGFRTVTPYPVARDAAGLIDFITQVFHAKEQIRSVGSAGGIHCELLLGDSMMMIGGGGPGLSWSGNDQPMAFHVYVPDTDATYQRALDRGAVSIQPPADHEYGERGASVRDYSGNHWYIATFRGDTYFRPDFPIVQPSLHPLRAEPVIQFLKRAFGATELGRYTTPQGVILHTTVKIGDSTIEMGEAHGPYQPMPGMFYLYLPNVDAAYTRALQAGADSTSQPADQPYGDRTATVKDVFGNQWCLATRIEDRKP